MIMVIKSIYSLQMKGNIRLDQLRKRDEKVWKFILRTDQKIVLMNT